MSFFQAHLEQIHGSIKHNKSNSFQDHENKPMWWHSRYQLSSINTAGYCYCQSLKQMCRQLFHSSCALNWRHFVQLANITQCTLFQRYSIGLKSRPGGSAVTRPELGNRIVMCSTYLYVMGQSQALGQWCKSWSNSITVCAVSTLGSCSPRLYKRWHTAHSITLPRGTSKTLVCCWANRSLLTV